MRSQSNEGEEGWLDEFGISESDKDSKLQNAERAASPAPVLSSIIL